VGNGGSTLFWLSNWIGGASLTNIFPWLYSLSNHKEGTIDEFFVSDGVGVKWSFYWRRPLFLWESDLLDNLLATLEPVNLSLVEDYWMWTPDPEGIFSVSLAYNYLVKELWSVDVLESEAALVFEHIWESPTPSKVIAFS
jgi:hypothetical protein